MTSIDDVSEHCLPKGEQPAPRSRPHHVQRKGAILYGVADVPSWSVIVFYALQQATATVTGGPLVMAYMVYNSICGADDVVLFAQLTASTIFMCGVTSIVQIVLGVRLPIKQGSSWTFLAPILAMMATDAWKCPPVMTGPENYNGTDAFWDVNGYETNGTNVTSPEEPPWKPRLQLISGGIVLSSLCQVVIGLTGVAGGLMHYIGPLTIVPCVSMIGLTLYHSLIQAAQHSWPIAAMSLGLFLLFSLFLEKVDVPYPNYSRKEGCHIAWFPVFKVFPLVFALVISWLVCYILTVTDTLPSDPSQHGYLARTDAKTDVLDKVVWFYVPYPGQWGWPRYGVAIFVGTLAATLASIIESMGDYIATARVCQVPPPPAHAMNRGILAEGLGGVLCGFMGICHNTTSYSDSIGYIAITGTASRVAWLAMAVVMILLGTIGKFGAALATIPEPIMGGIMLPSLGMVTAVAFSNLKYVNLESSRNLLILGLSHLLGLAIPEYVKDNPGSIDTGNKTVDQVLWVFLTTAMFVAGFIGFVLDNLAPGSKEERGIVGFANQFQSSEENREKASVYRLPWIGDWLDRTHWTSYIPISSSYKGGPSLSNCCRKGSVDEVVLDSVMD